MECFSRAHPNIVSYSVIVKAGFQIEAYPANGCTLCLMTIELQCCSTNRWEGMSVHCMGESSYVFNSYNIF